MRKVDLATLKRSAVAYVMRYAASEAMLAQVLQRRVHRWRRLNGGDPEGDAALIAEVVRACVETGLVEDARFAAVRTETLRARGWPERRVRMALRAKGIDPGLIDSTLEAAEIDDAAAARRFAERRRLGPWRTGAREDKRDKDIAALVRAGFGFSLAKATIDCEPSE